MQVIRIALILGILAVVAAEENAEFEYEDDQAPVAAPPARARSPLLAPRQAKPLPASTNRLNKLAANDKNAQKSTTAKPSTKAPEAAAEEEAQEEYDDAPVEAAEEGSTEPPKRTVKPIVRPFRSNEELLALLKKRRQQAINTGSVVDRGATTSTTTQNTPVEIPNHKKSPNSLNGRRGRPNNSAPAPSKAPESNEAAPESESPKKQQSRKFSGRNSGRTTAAPAPVEYEDEPVEQPKPKPHFGGRGSRKPVA